MTDKSTRLQKTTGTIALLAALLIILVAVLPAAGKALMNENQPLDRSAEDLSCRFGVAAFGGQGDKLSELGAGWYLNFGTGAIGAAPAGDEYMPMVRLKQVKSGDTYLDDYTVAPPLTDTGLGARIDANPGATWIVGNEPDRGPTEGSSGQDDMMPNMYARAYHDVYEYIKGRDPSAKVATAGLVEITPGRIQYLDMVSFAYYAAYKTEIPADVWTMHLYVMPEVTPTGEVSNLAAVALGTDPALGMRESGGASNLCGDVNNDVYCFADNDNPLFFERQIRDMRTWMKAHGQQNKPLLITEYSILYPYEEFPDGTCDFLRDEFGQCFTPSRVSNYLRATFDLIDGAGELRDTSLGYPQDEYRLVQQLLWYSLYTEDVGNASNLYKSNTLTETETLTTVTLAGAAFQAEIGERTPQPNLSPWNAANVAGFVIAPATTATVTLSADIYNNGTTAAITTTTTFYADAAMTNVIGSASVPAMIGCARGPVSVNVEWNGLTPGVHTYWVKADSSAVVSESSENDNVTSGVVIIDPQQIFLPAVLRR